MRVAGHPHHILAKLFYLFFGLAFLSGFTLLDKLRGLYLFRTSAVLMLAWKPERA